MTIDVAIAGGGPNGLMLACELALAGVRPVVLEQLTEPSHEPKANGLVGQVVRLLDQRGLHQRITGHTDPPAPRPGYMFGAFPLDLTGLDPNPLHVLPVRQRDLESLLAERARELGVEVRRGHRLDSLAPDADGVDLQLAGPDGPYRLRARYLVGCDGGHSTVRKLAGIAFPGVTGPEVVHRAAHVTLPDGWVDERTGELDVPGHGRIRPFGYHRTERGVFVFAAVVPGKPLVAVLEWEAAPKAAEPPLTFEELSEAANRVLGARLPLTAPTGPGPHLLRRHRGANTRLAERYRSGRVLLAGDAAHVHSAVGGPGLNLGLQDVANLGWKLAAEVHGWAPPGLLDSYQSERRPVGERVFMHSQAQLALMAPGPTVTALRTLFGELLADPANTRRIAELLAGSDLRYPVGCSHPWAGRFVPELTGLRVAGLRVAELLHGAQPLLLDLSADGRFAPLAHGWRDRVAVQRTDCPGESTAALLIRPDGYLAWAADHDGAPQELHEALTRWFGEPLAD
ncbi:FAD-dependent monooxygenase [Kitasatospora sp. RB6PN24]|uniref:FAD-dependent monooxygenase n=1 Tax=Kitasatospora humi TaxID=2893891 RepID=UPI001E419EEA|nr:FAD-dependent monooxygenase [Kitasatospora humi]MCC9307171.1 FAD-dependent monooxygenase [Kitasatospora humi]